MQSHIAALLVEYKALNMKHEKYRSASQQESEMSSQKRQTKEAENAVCKCSQMNVQLIRESTMLTCTHPRLQIFQEERVVEHTSVSMKYEK